MKLNTQSMGDLIHFEISIRRSSFHISPGNPLRAPRHPRPDTRGLRSRGWRPSFATTGCRFNCRPARTPVRSRLVRAGISTITNVDPERIIWLFVPRGRGTGRLDNRIGRRTGREVRVTRSALGLRGTSCGARGPRFGLRGSRHPSLDTRAPLLAPRCSSLASSTRSSLPPDPCSIRRGKGGSQWSEMRADRRARRNSHSASVPSVI